MAIQRNIQNLSTEATEAVNIAPFNRAAWAVTSTTPPQGALSFTESRRAGETPEFPLVKRVSIRPARVWHPATSEANALPGKRYSVDVHTTCLVVNDVSGEELHLPVAAGIHVTFAGNQILDTADTLKFILSAVAELYNSVTAGVPESVSLGNLGLGITNI